MHSAQSGLTQDIDEQKLTNGSPPC